MKANYFAKRIIKILNILGPIYYGGTGIQYASYDCYVDDFTRLKHDIKKNRVTVKHYDEVLEHTDICNDDDCEVDIEYKKSYIDKLMGFKSSFDKIIVTYTNNGWYGNLEPWYNFENDTRRATFWSGMRYDITDKCPKNALPKLSSRKYITIVDFLMKIKIQKSKKKSSITIDDILFATRGLMLDSTRSIFRYKVLNVTDKTLVLEPEIDNYST
jgi:hypothetical protein